MRVTQGDILDAMRAVMLTPEAASDGLTGPELMARMGVGRPAFTRCMRQMLGDGRAEVVTVRRPAMDGRQMTLRGYRLKKVKRAA